MSNNQAGFDNYARIVRQNLERLDWNDPDRLARCLPARRTNQGLALRALGRDCRLRREGIDLDGRPEQGPVGILISLYALHAGLDEAVVTPLKAFKEFPGSLPYVGAFATHSEAILVAHVHRIMKKLAAVKAVLDGADPPGAVPGDAAVLVWPLPKIALCYLLYAADEDFPAAATCLFSANADRFLPLDALADIGEYTSRRLIELSA